MAGGYAKTTALMRGSYPWSHNVESILTATIWCGG